jgi:hypothetical protein
MGDILRLYRQVIIPGTCHRNILSVNFAFYADHKNPKKMAGWAIPAVFVSRG